MAVAAGHGAVWTADRNEGVLLKIDPVSGEIAKKITDVDADTVLVADDAVWIVDYAARKVVALDPVSGERRAEAQLDLETSPKGLAVTPSAIWIADTYYGLVLKASTTTGHIERTIEVGDGPLDIELGHGSLWVANWSAGSVSRIDPRSSDVQATIDVGGKLGDLAVDETGVWVTVFSR